MTDSEDSVARSQIAGHIDVCTERYGSLWTAVTEIKRDLSSVKGQMFSLMAATCGAAVLGLCGVVFYLLTSRLPHP